MWRSSASHRAMDQNLPTLGELIKFAYETAGVLPRKRVHSDHFSESKKKVIQKKLERLSKEEGNLTETTNDLISNLAYLVTGAIRDPSFNLAIGECLLDLHDLYKNMLRNKLVFHDKDQSIWMFCRMYVVPNLAVSIQKYSVFFQFSSKEISVPTELNWFLPTVDSGKPVWPITKVMRWIYESLGLNLAEFHAPDRNSQNCKAEQKQNLENASAWFGDKRVPSWSALYWNFSSALAELKKNSSGDHKQAFSVALEQNFYAALFIARASTFVGKQIEKKYGQPALMQLIVQFSSYSHIIETDWQTFKELTKSWAERTDDSCHDPELDWPSLYNYFVSRIEKSADELDVVIRNPLFPNYHIECSKVEHEELSSRYGEFATRLVFDRLNIQREVAVSELLDLRLSQGLELLKPSCDLTEQQIDRFLLCIEEDDLLSELTWLERWIRAVYYYRRGDYQVAFAYIDTAFHTAKYRAGKAHYELVNFYLELAAKTSRWKDFKKGVAWSSYLDIPVRWLRDKEPTESNLRSAFEILKLAVYDR